MKSLMYREIHEEPALLPRLEAENKKVLTALADRVRAEKIRSIVLAGRGTSDHAAIFGSYLLTILGNYVCTLAEPSAITLYGAMPDYSGCLVLAVSQSGCAADALAVLLQGKQSGAVTCAITNDPESPLAREADYHLSCACGTERSVAATKTFTAELGLMILLGAYLCDKPELAGALVRTAEPLEELFRQEETVREAAAPFRYASGGFILSRGLGYPMALEAALKLKETCCLPFHGYASSDFYHGPLAQIDPQSAVLVMALSGHALEDLRQMMDRLTSIGASPLLITDDPGAAARWPRHFLLPAAPSEETAPLLLAAFLQLFACFLSEERGTSPDHPRYLSKVTVTR